MVGGTGGEGGRSMLFSWVKSTQSTVISPRRDVELFTVESRSSEGCTDMTSEYRGRI
jgi:hypothetical protein